MLNKYWIKAHIKGKLIGTSLKVAECFNCRETDDFIVSSTAINYIDAFYAQHNVPSTIKLEDIISKQFA